MTTPSSGASCRARSSAHSRSSSLLASAHYLAGDCAAVRSDLGRMPDLSEALRAEVTEWQARCDFEQRTFNGPLVPRGPFR